jgi:catechol 2,3-dioxygenase-like lactoylglutathione lyase family enzyme
MNPRSLAYIAPVFRVADLARSLAYYCDKLGFEVEFNYEGFYASVLRDGCRIHLKCSPPATRDQTAFESAEHLDACVGVQHADKLASELASRGAVFTVMPRSAPYGREFYVRDPDGYILGFIQPAAE